MSAFHAGRPALSLRRQRKASASAPTFAAASPAPGTTRARNSSGSNSTSRSASYAHLHPLTHSRNQLAAKSAGALREDRLCKSDGSCNCKVCSSPGEWRCDNLNDEVDLSLSKIVARVKGGASREDNGSAVAASDSGSKPRVRSQRSRSILEPGLSAFDPVSPRKPLRTSCPVRSRSQQQLGVESPLSLSGRMRAETAESMVDSEMSFLEKHKRRKAAAAVVWRKRSPSEIQRRRQLAASRRQAEQDMFVERSRNAWTKKVALIENRREKKEAEVAARIASRGPPKVKSKDKLASETGSSKEEALASWLKTVCIVLSLRSFQDFADGDFADGMASQDEFDGSESSWSSTSPTPSPSSPKSPKGNSRRMSMSLRSGDPCHNQAWSTVRLTLKRRLSQVHFLAEQSRAQAEQEKSSQEAHRKWKVAAMCCLAVVKFRQLLVRKRAGVLVASFAKQLLLNRNLGVEVMMRLKQIRLIQRCVKRWYFQQCLRKKTSEQRFGGDRGRHSQESPLGGGRGTHQARADAATAHPSGSRTEID